MQIADITDNLIKEYEAATGQAGYVRSRLSVSDYLLFRNQAIAEMPFFPAQESAKAKETVYSKPIITRPMHVEGTKEPTTETIEYEEDTEDDEENIVSLMRSIPG